jgi:hypothetical protein
MPAIASLPNLQNLPIRTTEGKRLRETFVPTNPVVMEADFIAIELRALTIMAQSDPDEYEDDEDEDDEDDEDDDLDDEEDDEDDEDDLDDFDDDEEDEDDDDE